MNDLRRISAVLILWVLAGCSQEGPTEKEVREYLFQETLKNIPITFTLPQFEPVPSFHVGKARVERWEGEKCLLVPFETDLQCGIDSKWFYKLGEAATFRVGEEASKEMKRRFGEDRARLLIGTGTILEVKSGDKFHVSGRIIYTDNGSGEWAEKAFVFDAVDKK